MLFLAGVIAITLCAVIAHATSLSRLSFDQLAKTSTAVARLRCIGATSFWESGEIWTETRFEVLELDKGLLPRTVSIRMMGGSDGHLRSHVDGVPVFRAGEEVYLFMYRRSGESYRVLGWSQGTFRIAHNPRNGSEEVTQDSAGAPMFDPETRSFQRAGIHDLPVAAFREKLHRALGN
jgi:hypothetical protein